MTDDTKDDGIDTLGKMIAGAAADALIDHLEAALKIAIMLGYSREYTVKNLNAAMLTWPGWIENKGEFDPAEADRLIGKKPADTVENLRAQLNRVQ